MSRRRWCARGVFALSLLLCATPASAAFTLIASAQAGSTDHVVATTSGVDCTSANLIVASVSWYYPSGASATVTDSNSNTYTGLTAQTQSTHVKNQLFYVYGPTVGAGQTFTATAAFASIQVLCFSGSASSPLDASQNGAVNDSAATLATGSITPAVDNEVVIAGLSHEINAGAAVSINGGFTAITTGQNGNHEGGGIGYLIQTTAAAANPTWNITNAAQIAVTIAAFKASGGAAAAVPSLMLLGVGP